MYTGVKKLLAFFTLCSLLPCCAIAQDSIDTHTSLQNQSIFDHFSKQKVLEIKIITNIDNLLENRYTDESQKASLELTESNATIKNKV